jgi:hypothetical protein
MIEAMAWGLFWWIVVAIVGTIVLTRLTGMND